LYGIPDLAIVEDCHNRSHSHRPTFIVYKYSQVRIASLNRKP